MKRYIAGLACAATAVLGAPALASTAHAQAADPLSALEKRISAGGGVNYTSVSKQRGADKGEIVWRRTGSMRFGASGVDAWSHTSESGITQAQVEELSADLDEKDARLVAGLAESERVIRVKNVGYVSGGVFGQFLPTGKPWLRLPAGETAFLDALGPVINPAEPATLKALLARATVKRPTLYAGEITFGELRKVSPWFRASHGATSLKDRDKTTVKWKLFLGGDQLAKRLTVSASNGDEETPAIDTRYSGWGSKVTVKAPPAGQIATVKELEEGFETEPPVTLLTPR